MSRTLSTQDAPLQRAEIRQIIAAVLFGGAEVRLHLDDASSILAPALFDAQRDAIRVEVAADIATRAKKITLQGYSSAYMMACDRLEGATEPGWFRLPGVLAQHQRRDKKRAAAPPAWRLRCVDEDGITVERDIDNISVDGISMAAQAHDERLFSRYVLTPIQIWDGPNQLCHILAELCNVAYGDDGSNETKFGLRIRAADRDAWHHWESAARPILHPTTRDSVKSFGDVWTVFDKSGYFSLSDKQPDHFASLKEDHDRLNTVFVANPQLGTHTLWQGQSGSEACISCCVPYAHTAVMHQMAKVSGGDNNRVIMRDLLISGFEHIKHIPAVDWVVGLLNDKVSFNKFAFMAFTHPYVRREQGCMLPFHLVEVDCTSAHTPTPTVHLVEANEQDYLRVGRRIVAVRGRIYAEAFDLVEARLDAKLAQARWRRVGIQRERKVVVVYNAENEAVAAGVMDIGPKGSNVFNILDALTVVSMQPGDAAVDRVALLALLDVARRWFSRHGKSKFIWHDLDCITANGAVIGTTDLGPGTLWIIARDIISDLQEYWYTRMMRPRD